MVKRKIDEKQTECKGEKKKIQNAETSEIYTREEVNSEINRQQDVKGKIQNKEDAIEFLRNKIIDEITVSFKKSTEFQLAVLLWDAAAKCFPSPFDWTCACFKLDLVTKRLFVAVSTYPNQFGACWEDKFSISTEKFNQIVNEYGLQEELKFIKTDEDLDMIFDENLNEIIRNTQKIIQQEEEQQQAEERMKYAIVLSENLRALSPSMKLNKVTISLSQPYSERAVSLQQSDGEYHLSYISYSKRTPGSRKYEKKLSLPEAVWVEEQIGNIFENEDKTTWQSLPGGDTMKIEIVSSQGEIVNMGWCTPLEKYKDLLDQLENLAEYGSRFE